MASSDFYDSFVPYQIKTGINDRIYSLYKRICRLGIGTKADMLEIGCGIGSLTYLIARNLKEGKIEALDISPKSIEFASKNRSQKNLSFTCADIFTFSPVSPVFDKILLFDVLEHIPNEKHLELFGKISDWMHDASLLLINIPNPDYILYDQKNDPHSLQEIDNPVFLHQLANVLDNASLSIHSFETYSVWVKDDYQFLVVKKKSAFLRQSLSENRSPGERMILRVARAVRKIIYR